MKTAYYLLAASTLLLTFSCISSTGPDDPEPFLLQFLS